MRLKKSLKYKAISIYSNCQGKKDESNIDISLSDIMVLCKRHIEFEVSFLAQLSSFLRVSKTVSLADITMHLNLGFLGVVLLVACWLVSRHEVRLNHGNEFGALRCSA